MKILMVYRKKGDEVEKFVNVIKKQLIKRGDKVSVFSREDDLNMPDLSSSMGGLKDFVRKKDEEEKYDRIYTFDWSIAFPLLFPTKILKEKHFCFFYDVEPNGGKSKVLQKITAGMLGDHLFVKTKELKEKFSKAKLFDASTFS
ncbi:MAG: hypothetical protein NUV97_02655 [archaeon]|nr:hypothetical protein [archaeon]